MAGGTPAARVATVPAAQTVDKVPMGLIFRETMKFRSLIFWSALARQRFHFQGVTEKAASSRRTPYMHRFDSIFLNIFTREGFSTISAAVPAALCFHDMTSLTNHYTGFISLPKNFGTGASKAIRFPLCG